MRISFSKGFLKDFKKSSIKIKQAFQKRIALFEIDTRHQLLNNHALAGDYIGYRSINITGDWRAVYKQIENGVYFVALGSHGKLYK